MAKLGLDIRSSNEYSHNGCLGKPFTSIGTTGFPLRKRVGGSDRAQLGRPKMCQVERFVHLVVFTFIFALTHYALICLNLSR